MLSERIAESVLKSGRVAGVLGSVPGLVLSLLLPFFLFFFSSCSEDDPKIISEDDTKVKLKVSVKVLETLPQTRAPFPPSQDGTFEAPATIYENLHSLRVIIVRPDGIVEFNRMVSAEPGASVIPEMIFETEPGEIKLYLFANEAAVDYDFDAIAAGAAFPKSEVESIVLERKAGEALIDNSSGTDYEYLPMSEVFDITIRKPDSEADRYQSADLFLTRSVIKFSFHFEADKTIYNEDDGSEEGFDFTGVKIEKVKIDGLADAGYYLPRNTVYSPEKYTPASNRIITAFDVPADAGSSSCEFTLPTPPVINSSLDTAFSPYVYLPESKTSGTYQVSVLLSGDKAGWLTSKPLEIKDIPRNTHLKINIKITDTDLIPTVTLVPYTECVLDPSFGL